MSNEINEIGQFFRLGYKLTYKFFVEVLKTSDDHPECKSFM